MASYQRVALFLLFDSIEQDLIRHIRILVGDTLKLTEDEQSKARRRLLSLQNSHYDADVPLDLLHGLDIAEKYQILLRHKNAMPEAESSYFSKMAQDFMSIVSVRNSVMHARPLTIEEYSKGFAFAQSLLKSRSVWQILADNYQAFTKDPSRFTSRSIEFLDDANDSGILHNLPTPEYDDTGFLPRPELERELKKRILGRHPVVTILGEGGNGKTALALQTLYSIVSANDPSFDAIVWVSAKTSMLTAEGIKRIGDDVVSALSIIESAAELEPGSDEPIERLRKLLENNKILLCIDNLETVKGEDLKKLAEDVPGQSKLLLTSRIPLGSDLSISVGEFSDRDALIFCRRLLDAYEVRSIKNRDDSGLLRYLNRLNNKPLLIKWFVLGVKSGLNPDKIVADPKVALRFCLENVVERLENNAQICLIAMATITTPLSAQILEHITDLDSIQIEVALSDLARFGLVDLVASPASEQLYRLRPFARSYAVRVISPRAEVTSEIRSKYTRIEVKYESVRALGEYNPYSLKNYKVRSPAEMLASFKLNWAVQAALEEDFDRATEIVASVQISDPAYFEVYRVLGYVTSLLGDTVASCGAYESAIELAPDQPQLHFFYGCMLMRGVNNQLASEHFEKAMALDPNALPVYREAARNAFSTGDFDRAECYLDKVKQLEFKSYKDKIVYTDLRIQLYVRKLNHRVQARDWDSSIATVKDLAYYVYGLDLSIFDERMTGHLLNAQGALLRIIEFSEVPSPLAKDLSDWIRAKFASGQTRRTVTESLRKCGPASGVMKRQGLQSTFGFLRADDGRETFLHDSDAGEELWRWLLDGGRVHYEIIEDTTGRTRATGLRKG